jgi:sulfur carrier protein ThiS
MAFFIKVIDTSFKEHTHLIVDTDSISMDVNNESRFKEKPLKINEQTVRDLIWKLDMTPEDCGFDKDDFDF